MQPNFPQELPPPNLGNACQLGEQMLYTIKDSDDSVIPEILNCSLNDYLIDCSGVREFHKAK